MTSASARAAQAARRRLRVVDDGAPFPAYVVWELTLACDHACHHCGSRAARPRPQELTTEQALAVVEELADLGTRELVLIGGEAYLHPGFLRILEAARVAGITPAITTGGAGVTAELAEAMARAGLARASVSVDGLAPSHDRIRGKSGSFAAALSALEHLRRAGVDTAANTTLNRINQGDLEVLYEILRDAGIRSWQVQLTVPLGRAADHQHLLLQPWMLLELLPRVDALKTRALGEGVLVMPGNNLGYFGPEELRLRSQHPEHQDAFLGCQAGRFVMGIESDGTLKGCPSLPTRGYAAGRWSPREGASVASLWQSAQAMGFARGDRIHELWGRCAECEFGAICQGGCSFTAHAILGRRGNNPYCHHRARRLRGLGLRERLVRVEAPDGTPFDHGRFALVEEPFDAPIEDLPDPDLIQLRRR